MADIGTGTDTGTGTRPRRNVSKDLLREKAKMIRRETVKLTDICGSGHYGSSFSMAELVASLYYEFMHVRADEPQWMDRDRFTMGKGHAAIGLYPVLADLGFFPWDDLYTYTRLGSPYGDHPDMRKVKGADFGSGSIGHNLSVSVGMALGLRKRGSPGRVVCMMGDAGVDVPEPQGRRAADRRARPGRGGGNARLGAEHPAQQAGVHHRRHDRRARGRLHGARLAVAPGLPGSG